MKKKPINKPKKAVKAKPKSKPGNKERQTEAVFMAAKTDFVSFAMLCFDILFPRKKMHMNWHIEAILHQLEMALNGERPRLIINIAPRHLKSILSSVIFPAWILAHNPGAGIICISYNDELGKTFSRHFKRIFRSPQFKALFPDVRIGDKDTEGEITTTAGGYRMTTSVEGTLTGRGADFIIIDDPIKGEDAKSDKKRVSLNEWFDDTQYSRLDDKEKSVCIVVMQRLHENDLSGHLEKNRGFFKLALSSIAEEREVIPLGRGRRYIREAGEALQPIRESLKTLDDIKRNMGSVAFSAQYLQKPLPAAGNIIKRSWIKYYTDLPETGGIFVWSWDTASSVSQAADYSAGTLWYLTEQGYYLVDVVRGKYEFNELRRLIINLAREHNVHGVLIEDADSGRSMIQSLFHGTDLRIISRPTGNGKLARAETQSVAFEAGRVYFPRNAPFLAMVLDEMLVFPNGKNDDQVDSITHVLEWASNRRFESRMREMRGERPRSPHRRLRRRNNQYMGGLNNIASHFGGFRL